MPRFRLRVPVKVKSPAKVRAGLLETVTTFVEVLSSVVVKPRTAEPAPKENVPVPSAPALLTFRPLLAASETPPARVLAPERVKTEPLPERASEPRPAKLPAKVAGTPAAALTERATATGVASVVLRVMVPAEVLRLVRLSVVTPAPKPTLPPESVRAPEVPKEPLLLRTNVPAVTVVAPV